MAVMPQAQCCNGEQICGALRAFYLWTELSLGPTEVEGIFTRLLATHLLPEIQFSTDEGDLPCPYTGIRLAEKLASGCRLVVGQST